MKNTQQTTDSDYTFERIPKQKRKSFRSMFFIMMGFTFFSASMSAGARLGNSMDLSGFLQALLIGGIFLAIYTGILAYIGCDTGLSFDLLAKQAFGRRGSLLPSLMICITQIGWFGVGVAMFSLPAAETLHVSPLIFVALAGICMTASAYFGIKGMEIISTICVPMISLLGTVSVIMAVSQAGGPTAVFAHGTNDLSVLSAAGIVVGSFISGGTATPNFSRFASSAKNAVISTVVAFFLGNSLMFIFGAVGGAFTGKDDIFYVMKAQGLLIPALFVLGANIWTTNDNALYSGGLGLSNITGYRKKPMVIVAGTVGTICALWIYKNFIGWLTFLNAALPPIGAILILDYAFHRSSYLEADTQPVTIRWGAVIGVIAGAIAGNFLTFGVAGINAMAAAAFCYLATELMHYH